MKIDEVRLARDIIRGMLITMYEDGEITAEDLASGKAMDAIKAVADRDKDESKFLFVIDHRETILKDAKRHLESGKDEYARLFTVLYFEHETNHLIRKLLVRRKIEEKSIKTILRLPILDKLTWALDLLDTKRPGEDFLRFIKSISDDRNSFTHYKFIGVDEDFLSKLSDKQRTEILNKITYFRKFVSKSIYNSEKAKVNKLINKLVK